MEAARRLDEWRVLSKKIPSTDLVPEFVVQENREGQINLNTSEWLILSKIDGHRSVKAIAGGQRPLGVRRGQDPLRPDRHRPHPAEGARAAAAPAPRRRRPRRPRRRPAARDRRRPAASAEPRGPPARPPPEPSSWPSSTACARSAARCSGPVGESVVNKHYQKAKGELERGAGLRGDRGGGRTRSRAPPRS